MKDEARLQRWEEIVSRVKKHPDGWRATKHSYICTQHFEKEDYILSPPAEGSCRLKRNATPSLFKLTCRPFSYNITEDARCRVEMPENNHAGRKRSMPQDGTAQPKKSKVDVNYSTIFKQSKNMETSNKQLKAKVRNLQQQLQRCKTKISNMSDIINNLQDDLVIKTEVADRLHKSFDKLQLSIFYNSKNNTMTPPCGRRYTDDIKEFSLTLHYYSPKAYEYVRSILPLPNPSLIRKWSSSVNCEPGFLDEAFESLKVDVEEKPERKDCSFIIDAMSIRKQTLLEPNKERYSGFVNYGPIPADDPDIVATEALVFLLVGSRSNWKCPIGYFLTNKTTGIIQAKLVRLALEKAADAGLRVWSITADGTSVNLSTFEQLGCKYDSMITKFKHPSRDYYVYVILDACHMLKLARNALGSIQSFYDKDDGKIQWSFFQQLCYLQEAEGFNLGNKFSTQHLQFEKHKMNVRLAAQTLSSSVADAIEFLDVSMKLPQFNNSQATVNFIRIIDRAFDILNSRNPMGKGYKQPLRQESRSTWESILKGTVDYLLSLVTITDGKKKTLSTHKRKTFLLGFVATIKSIIEMSDEMFTLPENPFKYILTYKLSQDHIELLFSCIRSKGGWNNNPNSLQIKYALRKMLIRNAVKASKNSNCTEFSDFSSGIIPIFHRRKHSAPLVEENMPNVNNGFTPPEHELAQQLEEKNHSEFVENILYYISGYIVAKLIKSITCTACKNCLISRSLSTPRQLFDHDYEGSRPDNQRASAYTQFVNKGGLTIPSASVFDVIKYAEIVFKACVSKDGRQISSGDRLRSKMIVEVSNHFFLDKASGSTIFSDHDPEMNNVNDDHRVKLIKHTADRYFTLRLFTYGKRHCETVLQEGKPSDRHHLTKLILFKNQ